MSDFSAVIGISGNQRGCVYYTAPRAMVQALAEIFGESDLSDDICADFV
ncbi:MAG: chemotaxis protein CheX, partial [Candidatus Eremiobacteraeota bacterium]|nr:chemotaxis protein CheX [Candidatus Eremiobacteraeota bacterium]